MPNARPGSMTTASASRGGCSHGGPTQSRPTLTGRWNVAPPILPASSTSVERAPPKTCQTRSSPAASVYATSSTAPSRSTSSKPPGKSSSIAARASSTRSSRTSTVTRRSSLSGTRSSACRRSPRRGGTSRSSLSCFELGEQAPLLVGEPPRDRDVHEHSMVATAEALEHRHAAPANTRTSPGCAPGSSSSVDLAVERLDLDARHRAPPATIVRSTCEKMSLPSRTKRGSGSTWTRRRRRPRGHRARRHDLRPRRGCAARRGFPPGPSRRARAPRAGRRRRMPGTDARRSGRPRRTAGTPACARTRRRHCAKPAGAGRSRRSACTT